MEAFNTSYVAGDYQAAIEAMAPSSLMPGEPDKDEQVLELLHQAEAYRLAGEPQTAIDLYDQAEAGMKLNDTDNLAEKGAENALAVLVNDAQRDYRPMLAEAVLVNTYKGLAFLQLGNASNARVEFNRADDRTRRAVAAFAEEIAEQKAALEEQAEADANREQQAIQQSLDSDALHESVAQQYGAPSQWGVYPEFIVPSATYLHGLYFLASGESGDIDADRLRLTGERLAPGDASRRLTQSLVRAFVGSRRFSVLDRDMRDAIAAEQRFVASGQVPLEQKAMLGRNLGADYLVTSRLTGMDMALKTVTNPVSGERSQEATGAATLEARVVVPATGQVMWSETLNVSLDDLGIASSSGDFTQQVFDALGSELTFRALNVIYPLRVVESRGDEIVLNQGGAIVQAGQRFGVFDIGKRYTDPYHVESLGPRENWTADVEITRVTDKIAYARIIKGQVEGDGQVLRRTATGKEARESERAAQRGTRERVCLPMDPC